MSGVMLMRAYWLTERNYRGELVPTGAGLFLLAGTTIGWIFALYLGRVEPDLLYRFLCLGIIIGAAGLLDDLVGNKENQGFKGHFRAVLQGRITTGFFKAATALATGILILPYRGSVVVFLLDLLLVLLMTNLFNLFDLRPGRALKLFFLGTIPLLATLFYYLAPIYLIIAIYLPYELGGRIMLGDTGSNALGALVGLGYVTVFNLPLKVLILLVLISLTILSEGRSISRIIARNGVLNWFDQLGRPRHRGD